MYRNEQSFKTICLGYENYGKAQYDGVGKYNIPEILPCEYTGVKDWIPWSQRNCVNDCANNGLHFYIHDFQFMGTWRDPDKYLKSLYKYKYVLSPDFSMFTDFPMALQIYSHYRKHWLARYWQEHYINVIPTIGWSTKESFEWCFDGEPIGSTVCVSSQSVLTNKYKKLFLDGYKEMMLRLEPKCIIFYGDIPDECQLPSRVVHMNTFSQRTWQNS